jgi:hypothetical protein
LKFFDVNFFYFRWLGLNKPDKIKTVAGYKNFNGDLSRIIVKPGAR